MKNQRSHKLTAGLFTLVYVITMLCTAFPAYVAAIEADDIRAFVDFENEYPDIENPFTVWGEYTGAEEDEIQIFSAVYDSKGKLLQAKTSEKVTLIPEKSFAVYDSITVSKNADLENAVLKVFIWDSTGGMQALGKLYRVTDKSFTYTLDGAARTSAGVFDDEGNLIRTLWGGLEEDAGTYTKVWDGCDDNGVLQPDGDYTVKVMENNVEVEASAYVGNTSDHSHYNYIMSGYANFLSDMMYVDGDMYYIYPYSEGRPAVYYFDVDNPDRKAGEFGGTNRCMQRATTDGKRMYVLNTEPAIGRTFLYAYDLGSRQMYTFAGQGQWIASFWGTRNAYCAVNIVDHNEADFQTGGIGVQTDGDWIFVSYVAEDKVYVVDKNNGNLINSQEFDEPRGLAYNDNGGLWIGSMQKNGKYAANRYLLGENGELTLDESVSLVDDFGYLLHLELSPDGKRIVVADGATNQYKMYSTETGELIWTFGSGESYMEDPTVYEDKLMLDYKADDTDMVFSEFESDDILWVGDVGNNRAYKMDISGDEPVIIDDIMLQAGSHSMGIDATNPENVYSNAMQYKMDYSKTGRDAWRVVKNWKQQVQAYGIDVVTFNQFNNIITLPNGKTYFSAYYDGYQRLFCYEKNYIRDTGINFDGKIMLDDGTVGSIAGEGSMAAYKLHKLLGYNEANDPIYDEAGEVIARLPQDRSEPTHVFGAMKLNMPISENNIMMTLRCTLQEGVDDRKTWHVGGVKIGDGVATDWQWKAAPEGSEHYRGNFPREGTFEAGNGVVNSAQKVVTSGDNVLFQYNGEFYRASQSNGLFFYKDNGLLIGVFGDAANQRRSNDERDEYGKEIFPGNAFDMYLIQDKEDSDRAYIMQNSENGYGNFKYNVTGLDTVKTHEMTVSLENALWDGLTFGYYEGDATDPANLVFKDWRSSVAREEYDIEADDFAMRYTGYITNPNNSDTLKLSINTKEDVLLKIGSEVVFDGAGAATPTIEMKQGKLYPFSLTIEKNASTTGGKTRISLNYYDANSRLQAFNETHFKTEEVPYTRPDVWKVDLLEGLPFASVLDSGKYGITRGTPSNMPGAGLNTNGVNPSFDDVRDIYFGPSLWPEENGMWVRSAWFAKNLGTPREDMWSWEIEMDVARTGYINYGALGNPDNSTGIHIDVLDVNDRVIARFFWAQGNRAYGNGHMIYEATDIYNNNLTPELYNVPSTYDNQFNTPSPLKIKGRDGQITFEYYGQEIRTTVLDPEADWTQPLKVKADAFFNYDRTQAREMGMSITKFDYTQYIW